MAPKWTEAEIALVRDGQFEIPGRSKYSVITKRLGLGIKFKDIKGRPNEDRQPQIDELRRLIEVDVLSVREAADKLGISHGTAAGLVHRHKIKSRNKRGGLIIHGRYIRQPKKPKDKKPLLFKQPNKEHAHAGKSAALKFGWDSPNVVSLSKQRPGIHRPKDPKPEFKRSPEQMLWQAVLLQAIEDATIDVSRIKSAERLEMAIKHRNEALKWFTKPIWRKDFIWVCEMAGFEPDWVLGRLSLEAA